MNLFEGRELGWISEFNPRPLKFLLGGAWSAAVLQPLPTNEFLSQEQNEEL